MNIKEDIEYFKEEFQKAKNVKGDMLKIEAMDNVIKRMSLYLQLIDKDIEIWRLKEAKKKLDNNEENYSTKGVF